LLAEFAPARLRGKLLAILELVWYVGYLVSYAIGWGLTESSMASWQVILGLSTVPTVIVFLMRLGTPESPHWLMSQ
ncbi:MFS transporter, partial [Escherichia coli]|nr:MFS transporter [Escherichia coli]